jgi:hypothetical protein
MRAIQCSMPRGSVPPIMDSATNHACNPIQHALRVCATNHGLCHQPWTLSPTMRATQYSMPRCRPLSFRLTLQHMPQHTRQYTINSNPNPNPNPKPPTPNLKGGGSGEEEGGQRIASYWWRCSRPYLCRGYESHGRMGEWREAFACVCEPVHPWQSNPALTLTP